MEAINKIISIEKIRISLLRLDINNSNRFEQIEETYNLIRAFSSENVLAEEIEDLCCFISIYSKIEFVDILYKRILEFKKLYVKENTYKRVQANLKKLLLDLSAPELIKYNPVIATKQDSFEKIIKNYSIRIKTHYRKKLINDIMIYDQNNKITDRIEEGYTILLPVYQEKEDDNYKKLLSLLDEEVI